MDTRQIDYFLALYREGSVRRAAETLYLTQQGLSRSIRELESELGVVLFRRSPKGMTPTRAGDYLFERIGPLRDQLADVCRNVALVADDTERIEVPCAFGTLHLLYGRLKEFASTTGTEVSWEEASDRAVEQLVLSGQRPMGICVRNQLPVGLRFQSVLSSPFVAVVSSDDELALRAFVSYEDLRERSLIMEGDEFNACRIFTDRCLACGFDPVVAVKTTEITLCLRLAGMGEGIAVVPDFIARQGTDDGVALVPFEDKGLVWEVGVISRPGLTLCGPYKQLADWLLQ